MTAWSIIRDFVSRASHATGLSPCLEKAWDLLSELGREPKNTTFTVALIALSAKMAKADGIVTADEIRAFHRILEIPPEEERHVERLFDLAKVDVAGFETYAARIVKIAEGDDAFLASVLDGLFLIATADSYVHEAELVFLERVGEIFGIVDDGFERILRRHVRRSGTDPYRVLGIDPNAQDDEIRSHWKQLVKDNHPDRHQAGGMSGRLLAEFSDRLAAINSAWDAIRAERGLH